MSTRPTGAAKSPPWDPVFLNSRREALAIFLVWIAALLWAVPYCYLNGYPDQFDRASFSVTMGIPSWLFWGILVPWIVADLVTAWFCFGFMRIDPLGDEGSPDTDDQDAPSGHSAVKGRS